MLSHRLFIACVCVLMAVTFVWAEENPLPITRELIATATPETIEKYIAQSEWWQKRKREAPNIQKLLKEQEIKIKDNKFTFAVIGDSYSKKEVLVPLLEAAEKSGIALYTSVGDFVGAGYPCFDYPFSDTARSKLVKKYRRLGLCWDGTAEVTDPFFHRIPHLPARGDHEHECGALGDINNQEAQDIPFKHFWGVESENNVWRFKNCLFITLSPEKTRDKEINWLMDELEKAKSDPKIEHIFIARHIPFYDIGKTGRGIKKGYAQDYFLYKLKNYKVTAVFSGHPHAYYRTVRDEINHIGVLACGATPYGQIYRDKALPNDSFFYIAGENEPKKGPVPLPLKNAPLPPKGSKILRFNEKESIIEEEIETLYGNYICIVEINGAKAKHWLLYKDGKTKIGEVVLKP